MQRHRDVITRNSHKDEIVSFLAAQGVRCLPQFTWVALAYHASGSVAPPALIHALWYLCDGKFVALLSTFKRDWDVHLRAGETGTTWPDLEWWLGWAFVVAVYALVERFDVEPFSDFSAK